MDEFDTKKYLTLRNVMVCFKGSCFPKRIRLLSLAHLDVHHVKTDAGAVTDVPVSVDADADVSTDLHMVLLLARTQWWSST